MEKTIDLEPYFRSAIRKEILLNEINACLKNLNSLIEKKNGVKDVFYAKIESGSVKVGYKSNPQTTDRGFHNDLKLEFGKVDNIAIFGFIIFDGCKEWGCYEDVPMYGAPEENRDSYFDFTLDETKYRYQLFTKK
jgi:hypothetical protein